MIGSVSREQAFIDLKKYREWLVYVKNPLWKEVLSQIDSVYAQGKIWRDGGNNLAEIGRGQGICSICETLINLEKTITENIIDLQTSLKEGKPK